MFSWLAKLFRKSAPAAAQAAPAGTGFIDAYRRQREPTQRELLAELKGTAWACASINAAICASFAPRLYVKTTPGQAEPKCQHRALSNLERKALTTPLPGRAVPDTLKALPAGATVAEVTDHPLLELFSQVNPLMNAFDLWELTTLYQEATGDAYWLLEFGAFGIPANIWVLPSQCVSPCRSAGGPGVVDGYLYRDQGKEQFYPADEVIHFSYRDLRAPYTRGFGPLRAAFEQVQLAAEFTAFRTAKFRNHAVPDALLCPEEVLGDEERLRLEKEWNAKMRKGGAGRVIVADSKLHMQLLSQSMGDTAALADHGATKEEVCNAFGVPMPFVSRDTNMANMQASKELHAVFTIRPRLRRRDEKLNERLLPLYDPTGRLFLWSDDPAPADRAEQRADEKQDLIYGVRTPNEVRLARGLAPVPWGDTPYLPSTVQTVQTDDLDTNGGGRPAPANQVGQGPPRPIGGER